MSIYKKNRCLQRGNYLHAYILNLSKASGYYIYFQIGWKYVSNFQNELKHIIFLKDK
jgi:hypothetical protein